MLAAFSGAPRCTSSMLLRAPMRGLAAAAARRAPASGASSAPAPKQFALRSPLQFWGLPVPEGELGVSASTATREELLTYLRQMYQIRRMELTFDSEYKARAIRGFCHLYDGQEAIAAGLKAALLPSDDIATAYRCHGLQLIRGDTVRSIAAELFGFESGSSKGKGGSMHFYSKARRFWGGSGIVGAQVPVGVGLGFANMYLAKKAWPTTISVAMYGDGAANQGQIWEAANMAKLWSIPTILLCENNQYGMGTSTARHSANAEYYKAGGVAIPGVQADGMDVLAVKEAVKYCRQHASSGKGPIYLEVKTYRYHGHSMSDPGITYRDRDEIATMRASRDCIEQVKSRLTDAGLATADEIKAIEKEIREEVAAEIAVAKGGKLPTLDLLTADIYYKEVPAYIRGAINEESLRTAK